MGILYIVGLGPGSEALRTQQAKDALAAADLFCGYTVYIDLIKDLYPDTPVLTTPMTKEIDRCVMALEQAEQGRTVAMVCSGDAGIYGMAGLCYQFAADYPKVEIVVVAGITAALGGAAVLGAPLTNDFAVISLSDLLTPWEIIERRITAAAQGDFVICLYNPASKRRVDHLQKACDLVLETRGVETACGWVRMIGRGGQRAETCTLEELRETTVDMFTTVFIGNSMTQQLGGKLVTLRGYGNKYDC